jgi:NADPH-dependent 2,4-dienoyl-CoA reductase/sulfur reductase-like enzyme
MKRRNNVMETTRRDCLRQAGALLAGGLSLGSLSPAVARGDDGDAVDVCVYGATASGIMAALAATRRGRGSS